MGEPKWAEGVSRTGIVSMVTDLRCRVGDDPLPFGQAMALAMWARRHMWCYRFLVSEVQRLQIREAKLTADIATARRCAELYRSGVAGLASTKFTWEMYFPPPSVGPPADMAPPPAPHHPHYEADEDIDDDALEDEDEVDDHAFAFGFDSHWCVPEYAERLQVQPKLLRCCKQGHAFRVTRFLVSECVPLVSGDRANLKEKKVRSGRLRYEINPASLAKIITAIGAEHAIKQRRCVSFRVVLYGPAPKHGRRERTTSTWFSYDGGTPA